MKKDLYWWLGCVVIVTMFLCLIGLGTLATHHVTNWQDRRNGRQIVQDLRDVYDDKDVAALLPDSHFHRLLSHRLLGQELHDDISVTTVTALLSDPETHRLIGQEKRNLKKVQEKEIGYINWI